MAFVCFWCCLVPFIVFVLVVKWENAYRDAKLEDAWEKDPGQKPPPQV